MEVKPTALLEVFGCRRRDLPSTAPQVLACLLLLGLLAAPGLAYGRDQRQKAGSDKKKKEAHEYALLFGTVFDENGRLVRGAEVRVRQKEGRRQWEARTDTQGEFAVRLPAISAVYIVEATAPGCTRDSKEVSFVADERQDVVLRISRQTK